MMADTLSLEGDVHDGEPLIYPVMAGGRHVGPQPSLHDIRAHARHGLGRLPAQLKEISPLVPYPVQVSASLEQLAAVTDQRTGLPELQP